MNQTIEVKCPSCGASLSFDAGTQNLRCPFCDSSFSAGDIPEQDLSIEMNRISGGKYAGSEWTAADGVMSEYHCGSCGGDIYTDGNTSATMCPYCGSSVMLVGRLTGSLKLDKVIPFKITKEDAVAKLKTFCSKMRLLPKNFFEDSYLEEIKGLYVPYWIYDFDVDADVDFTGVKISTTHRNGKTHTTRHYYNVVREGSISLVDVPVDGSRKMPDDLMESIEPFGTEDLVDFRTPYLSGFVADKYDVGREEAEQRAVERVKNQTIASFRSTTSYSTVYVKNAKMDVRMTESNYVLYPVWLFSTVWKGRRFTVAMNGQTGKIAGDLPLDKRRAAGYGAFAASVAMLLFGGYVYALTGEAIAAVIPGLLAGIMAGLCTSLVMIGKHKTVRRNDTAAYCVRDDSMVIRKRIDSPR